MQKSIVSRSGMWKPKFLQKLLWSLIALVLAITQSIFSKGVSGQKLSRLEELTDEIINFTVQLEGAEYIAAKVKSCELSVTSEATL